MEKTSPVTCTYLVVGVRNAFNEWSRLIQPEPARQGVRLYYPILFYSRFGTDTDTAEKQVGVYKTSIMDGSQFEGHRIALK